MKKNMRDGHAWSGREAGDALNASSPFKESSTTLEQALGLYEAAFSDTAQLLTDDKSDQAALPSSEGSVNVFEKQDLTTPTDCLAPALPFKRLRRCPHATTTVLRGSRRRIGKGLSQKTPRSKKPSEQSRESQSRERSLSEESVVLSQHSNSALCVC